YKDFLKKKRKEWNDNFQKYLTDKENEQKDPKKITDTKVYSHPNHYLISACANNSCNGKEFIGILSNKKEYGEYEKVCKCDATSSKKEEEANPCSDSYTEYGCTEKKYDLGLWSSTYVTNPRDHGRVFAPPRRNSICIGWLFSPLDTSGGKDIAKNELRKKVIDAAIGEAHYLFKYYNEIKQIKTGSSDNTTAPTGYCDALKRSFADIGDIVKGTDLWSGGYSELVENNIYAVFQLDNDGKNGTLVKTKEELLEERKSWWDTIRADVWKAMNCKDNNKCDDTTIPDDDKKPQFLRWLEEWGQYICEERKKHLDDLKNKCNGNSNNITDVKCANSTKECKQQCNKYNRWINVYKREWTGQKSKYKEIYDNKDKTGYEDYKEHVKDHDNTNKYIEKSSNKCKNSGSNHINLDDVFQKRDNDYKKYEPFCTTCRINDIAQKANEKNKQQKPAVVPSSGGGGGGTTPKNGANQVDSTKTASTTTPNCDDNTRGGCTKYIEADDYTKIKGQQNCEGLKKAADEGKIKWDNSDGGLSYLKKGAFSNDLISPNVYLPPRKQKLCFRGLDGKYDGKDNGVNTEDKLKEQLMKVAEFEGINLGEYYKEKNKQGQNNDKYNYDVSPCNALKYSFLDLRDLILGYDMVEHDATGTGNK
ncbi:putative EMP1-like protein, partial [Plasmodium gaboni]